MSSTYMPTSNWNDRTIKGRGSASAASRLQTSALARRDAETAGPVKAAQAGAKKPPSDGLMDQIQAAREIQTVGEVDVMDLPMDPPLALASSAAVMEQPLDDSMPVAGLDDEIGEVSTPTKPRQRTSLNLRNSLLMAAPVGVVAVTAVGLLMLNQGEGGPAPVAAPIQGSAPAAADEALVGMPVTDATVIPAAVTLAAAAQASRTAPEPRTTEPARASVQAGATPQPAPETATATVARAEPVTTPIVVERAEPVALEPVTLEPQAEAVTAGSISLEPEPPAPASPVTTPGQ